MKLIKERILQIMEELDKLSEHDYRTFELALILFLRSYKEEVETLSDNDLEELDNLVNYNDSLLDINAEDVDYILEKESEEEK